MLHELIGLKNNRLDLVKGDQPKININSKDFNVNDLKVNLEFQKKLIILITGICGFMPSGPFL